METYIGRDFSYNMEPWTITRRRPATGAALQETETHGADPFVYVASHGTTEIEFYRLTDSGRMVTASEDHYSSDDCVA